mgnify:CR=1 FL=1
MYFQQTWMLWGLLAASIPVIIHLLNRRRHKTVKWAAMQFLLKATRESRGKKRLRHILILICRTLGIAALVAAASLPLVGGFFGLGAGRPDLVVLVLDRSASMESKPENGGLSRRALAIDRVGDAISDLSGTRLVLIDSASGTPQEVPSPDVLAELSSTAATDSAADLPELLSSAAGFLAETSGRAEVWIASDLQVSNWSPEDDRWNKARASLANLPQPPRVRVLALGGESASNQGLRILGSRRNGDRLELDLEVARNGAARSPLNLPLTTTLNGARSTDSLTVTGQRLRFVKTLPTPETDESGYGWMSIPGDGNPRDNVAYFAYGPALPVASKVVAPPGEAADYLMLAAAPQGFGGQTASLIDPSSVPPSVAKESAAVFWSTGLPKGATADQLETFVREGGQLVLFPPASDSDTEFLGISWSEVQNAPADQFFILDSWDRADGLLRDGIDGTPVPADRLRAVKRRIPQGESSILARWDDTEPFLVRRIVGRGTAWFVGPLPDYTWSNLGDADVLLPLAQRAVVRGAERFDSGYLVEVGSPDATPGPNETRERLDRYDDATGARIDHVAGVYRFGDRLRAVNRPPEEDLAGQVETNAVAPLFDGLNFSLFEDRSGSAQENISRSVWRAFLIAMLFFLLAEALLCLPKPMPKVETPTAGPQTPGLR